MNKLQLTLQKSQRLGVIAVVPAGTPDLALTSEIILTLAATDIIGVQLNLPFSDSVAGGAVLEKANMCALAHGYTTDALFNMLAELRKKCSLTITLSCYANAIYAYGAEQFFSNCHACDISGVLVFDIPLEERNEFAIYSTKYNIDLLTDIAATDAARAAQLAACGTGYINLLALDKGEEALRNTINIIKKHTNLPVLLDIAVLEKHKNLFSCINFVHTGTALVQIITQHGKDAPKYIYKYIAKIMEMLKTC